MSFPWRSAVAVQNKTVYQFLYQKQLLEDAEVTFNEATGHKHSTLAKKNSSRDMIKQYNENWPG